MKKIFIIFLGLLFLPTQAFTSVPYGGLTASISMGGVTIPLSQAIVLTCHGITANNYTSCGRNDSPYQVPTGKKLVVVAIRHQAAQGELLAGGYGDNSTATSVPANNVNIDASPQVNYLYAQYSSLGMSEFPIYFEVPASKYPYFFKPNNANNMYIWLLAYLVNV